MSFDYKFTCPEIDKIQENERLREVIRDLEIEAETLRAYVPMEALP